MRPSKEIQRGTHQIRMRPGAFFGADFGAARAVDISSRSFLHRSSSTRPRQ
jgi:hypothetical protein